MSKIDEIIRKLMEMTPKERIRLINYIAQDMCWKCGELIPQHECKEDKYEEG